MRSGIRALPEPGQEEIPMSAGNRNLLMIALASASLAACQQGRETSGQGTTGNAATADADSASGGGGADVTVGGAQMLPNKTIADNVSQSADHTTLVGAIKAAGLTQTLSGAGPYTVFAPTNAAFQKLPAGTAEELMRAESKGALTGILTYHVVPGVVTAKDLAGAIQRGRGKAQLATMGRGTLTATQANGGITVTDSKGGQARVIQADVIQSNGVVHVVDSVLMPR
jgi:uncharacterized surface protein with fasciclin (FAS1) repeats